MTAKENEANEWRILTRYAEEEMARLFCVKRPFFDHLTKWEDDELPDKYDHNCFEYNAQPTGEAFRQALDYQRGKGANFLKLEGDFALTDTFGLEESVTLTLVLQDGHPAWKTNDALQFQTPDFASLKALEVKHYGPVYGEDFSARNIRRLYGKLDYLGAFLDGQLAGACYGFRTKPEGSSRYVTCIDGLLVDADHRHQYIATSLIAQICRTWKDDLIFLHADEDDTPKDMYARMGFAAVDRLYEYTCTDISRL